MLNGSLPKLSHGSLGAVMNSPGRRHSPSLGGCGRWALLNCKAFLASTLPVRGRFISSKEAILCPLCSGIEVVCLGKEPRRLSSLCGSFCSRETSTSSVNKEPGE